MHVVSPLNPDAFAHELACHPDQRLVSYVIEGLHQGFKLGFHHSFKLKSAKCNKPSALQHPSVNDDYLATKVSHNRVAGPFMVSPIPNLHVSSFGVIPKKGQPGKWHSIIDLSAPEGGSVNGGIDPSTYSLQYITVDDVICMVSWYGAGALMAKFYVEAAYRNVAVHPSD